jgi:hypothetical protein
MGFATDGKGFAIGSIGCTTDSMGCTANIIGLQTTASAAQPSGEIYVGQAPDCGLAQLEQLGNL